MKVTEIKAYQCNAEREYPKGSVCGKIYLDKDLAENCCKPHYRYCEVCGAEIEGFY